MEFNYNDGGRSAAGYKGKTGDCVCRSICIATGLPYQKIYDELAKGNAMQRKSKHTAKKGKTAAHGINTTRKWFKDYMKSLGFEWVATMGIGTGCKVHLIADELPKGRLVVCVSKHMTAVIDGVINDTYNPCRADSSGIAGSWMKVENGIETRGTIGERCVYGYYILTTN